MIWFYFRECFQPTWVEDCWIRRCRLMEWEWLVLLGFLSIDIQIQWEGRRNDAYRSTASQCMFVLFSLSLRTHAAIGEKKKTNSNDQWFVNQGRRKESESTGMRCSDGLSSSICLSSIHPLNAQRVFRRRNLQPLDLSKRFEKAQQWSDIYDFLIKHFSMSFIDSSS